MRKRAVRPLPYHRRPSESFHWRESDPPEIQTQEINKFKIYVDEIPKKRISWLEALYKEYCASENPLCVWDAWSLSRKWRLPVPEWVLEYMDGTAKLLLVVENKVEDIPRFLGFKTRLGRRTPFIHYRDLRARSFAVTRAKAILEKDPQSRTAFADAAQAVSEEYGVEVSEATVQKWYYSEDDSLL